MNENDLKVAIRQEPLLERLDRSRLIVGKLCSEGRTPKMSIPVSPRDEDMLICTTLKDASEEIARLRFFNEGIGKEIDELRQDNEKLQAANEELRAEIDEQDIDISKLKHRVERLTVEQP